VFQDGVKKVESFIEVIFQPLYLFAKSGELCDECGPNAANF